jgi:hypothetical protein
MVFCPETSGLHRLKLQLVVVFSETCRIQPFKAYASLMILMRKISCLIFDANPGDMTLPFAEIKTKLVRQLPKEDVGRVLSSAIACGMRWYCGCCYKGAPMLIRRGTYEEKKKDVTSRRLTAVVLAAIHQKTTAVQLLLEHGADINTKGHFEKAALHRVVRCGPVMGTKDPAGREC